MATQHELGFIGAGNMAEGILAAVLETGLNATDRIVVSDPVAQRRALFVAQFGVHVTGDNREAGGAARAILDAGGSTVVLRDESLMDAVTAMSGSGPAYFYYFVEAMVAGGTACGLSEADALKLAERTCLGAAKMMLESGEPPADLRRKVTSKGGTTQAALEHMKANGVGEAIRDAVRAAFDRGREVGS